MIERCLEWLYEECDKNNVQHLESHLANEIKFLKYHFSDEQFCQLNELLKKKKHPFEAVDYFDFVQSEIKKSIESGRQLNVYNLEKYLLDIIKREKVNKYSPILYGKELKRKKHILIKNIIKWEVFERTLVSGKHKLSYKCDCGNETNVEINIIFMPNSGKGEFICPKCRVLFQLEEADYFKYLKHSIPTKLVKNDEDEIPIIIFLTRDSHIIGGGNSVIYKHINWLDKLGFEIELISFGFEPDWYF